MRWKTSIFCDPTRQISDPTSTTRQNTSSMLLDKILKNVAYTRSIWITFTTPCPRKKWRLGRFWSNLVHSILNKLNKFNTMTCFVFCLNTVSIPCEIEGYVFRDGMPWMRSFKYEIKCRPECVKTSKMRSVSKKKNNINFSKAAVQRAVHWHESIPSALAATDQWPYRVCVKNKIMKFVYKLHRLQYSYLS